DAARFIDRGHHKVLALVPGTPGQGSVLVTKSRKLSSCFQVDLKLRELDIVGIAKLTKEGSVHDGGDRIIPSALNLILQDVERDGTGRQVLPDLGQEDLDAVVGDSSCKEVYGSLPIEATVLEQHTE